MGLFKVEIVRNTDLFSEAVFEFCPEGLFVIDADGVIQAFNRAMEEMTGWKREEVIGKERCLFLFRCRHEGGEAVCRRDCPGQAAFGLSGRSSHAELILQTREGREIVVSVSYALLPLGPKGSPQAEGYVIGVMREITQEKQIERAVEAQAVTDELTGLYNFRYLIQRLPLEIKRAERYHHPLSLIMLDIDYFKNYNDLHGHPQGNEVLKQMARLIRENTRESNIVARYGGDEFVILLPETEKLIAAQAAWRLCAVVRGAFFPYEAEQSGGNLTVSVGMASYPWDAEDGDGLIQVADELLYCAKRQGRNRIRWRRF